MTMASSGQASASSAVTVDESDADEAKPAATRCPFCNDTFTEPKLLPCVHRFCRKCLVTWFESSTDNPVCPVCKRSAITSSEYGKITADVNKGGKKSEGEGLSDTGPRLAEAVVDTLPTDTVLAVLADSTRKLSPPHVCSACPNNQTHAVDLCMECGDMLCRGCSAVHSRLSATSTHKVKHVADLLPEQLAKQVRETCQHHAGYLLELYCPAHAQPMCLMGFPIHHSQCQGVESVTDAAKRLRQALETQVQQLADAGTSLAQSSANLHQRQEELRESQVQVSKDTSYLMDRITSAVQARKAQLLKQAEQIPLPLKNKHRHEKEKVDEQHWVLSANQQLVLDSLRNASDANLLRVFGTLKARMTDLASQVVPQSGGAMAPVHQRAVLSVDQHDVLRIEELLKDLGLVEIVARDKDKDKGPKTFLPPQSAASAADSGRSKEFNPFLCRPRNIGQINVEGLRFPVLAMCKGDNGVIFASGAENSLFSVCTSPPYESKKLANLPCRLHAMAFVQGSLVMTTGKNTLLFLDVTKNPKPRVTTMDVSKAYRGITTGLENTVIVGHGDNPCCFDVITKEGRILRTVTLGCDIIPNHLCRLGDFVIVSGSERESVLRVGLETGKVEELSHGGFSDDGRLTGDHKGRLYIAISYDSVIVMDLKGQKKGFRILNHGGLVVSPDGKLFSFHPSPPADVPLLVYDLSKE